MKWFKNVHTLDELRKMYKKLAFQHHPDKGGNVEDMKAINNEYEKLSKKLINSNDSFSEERKTAERQYSADIQAKLNEILNIENINIELVGYWLWITGNTYPVREKIKKAGFKFSKQKTAWFWYIGDYHKKNGKVFDLDTIREMFGTEKIESFSNNRKFVLA